MTDKPSNFWTIFDNSTRQWLGGELTEISDLADAPRVDELADATVLADHYDDDVEVMQRVSAPLELLKHYPY